MKVVNFLIVGVIMFAYNVKLFVRFSPYLKIFITFLCKITIHLLNYQYFF